MSTTFTIVREGWIDEELQSATPVLFRIRFRGAAEDEARQLAASLRGTVRSADLAVAVVEIDDQGSVVDTVARFWADA